MRSKNLFLMLCVTCHRKLFVKLFSYGIRKTILLWLFFSDRTHQTKVDTSLSDVAQLLSGVVQGSGIGPLIFLIVYICELIDILENHGIKVKVFADDVKLYLRIVSDDDFIQFQAALNLLYFWANIIFGLVICPVAIAYSMGQIIKSVCVSQCVCQCVCPLHFLIDFHQNYRRRKNSQKGRTS